MFGQTEGSQCLDSRRSRCDMWMLGSIGVQTGLRQKNSGTFSKEELQVVPQILCRGVISSHDEHRPIGPRAQSGGEKGACRSGNAPDPDGATFSAVDMR